jgi:phosphoglycolate phosphatase-like HAD superfamily hydrolase
MTSFPKTDCIFWDFDGVLMNSMPVRDKGFELVLSSYPKEQVDRLMQYHRSNGGLSRYVKFRYFFEKILNQPITDEHVQNLAHSFSEIMLQSLLDPSLLIDESWDFVKRYHDKIDMHIVSGSDGKELNYICTHLGVSGYFKSIQGSPVAKRDLVRNVLADYRYQCAVLVGDSMNDLDAATVNNIEFVGYNNQSLKHNCLQYIESFQTLTLQL